MTKPTDLLDWRSCSNQHPKIYYDVVSCPMCEALRYKKLWNDLAGSMDMMKDSEEEED